MANTIVVSTNIKHQVDGSPAVSELVNKNGLRLSQTTDLMAAGKQSFTDASAGIALNVANVTTIGFGVFENLDANDFMWLGIDNPAIPGTFKPLLKLMPTGVYTIPLNDTLTWLGQADTGATVRLDYKILNT